MENKIVSRFNVCDGNAPIGQLWIIPLSSSLNKAYLLIITYEGYSIFKVILHDWQLIYDEVNMIKKKMKNLLSFQLFYHIHQHDRNKICFLPLGQVLRFIEQKLWNTVTIIFHLAPIILSFCYILWFSNHMGNILVKNPLHDITKTVWTSHIQHQMFRTLKISNVHYVQH